MKWNWINRKMKQGAFSRSDLVALVAICSLLLPLVLMASQKSEEDIRRMRCRDNLRQIGSWLIAYANDNDDNLPRNSGGGWAWDTGRNLIISAGEYGVSPDNLYCPSGVGSEGIGLRVHFEFSQNFALIDYVLAVDGTQQLFPTNLNETLTPPTIFTESGSFTPKVSERELASDAVLSTPATLDTKDTARFFDIIGGSPIPHRTNHMIGERPAGGNILFLDGQVEWRDFDDGMVPRNSGYPAFWY